MTRAAVEVMVAAAGVLFTGGVVVLGAEWWGIGVGIGLGLAVGGVLLALFALIVVDVRSSEGVHTGSRPGRG